MDDILKETMRAEVNDVIAQIEAIVHKYGSSNDIVYTIAVGFVEDSDDEMANWALQYGYNCRNIDEFEEFMHIQANAFVMSSQDDHDDGFLGYSLN